MKKILVLLVAVAAAYPAAANATSFKGVVVAKSHGTLAVAARSGAVRTVATRRVARVGAVVAVRATRTKSGVFRASRVRVVGRASRVHVRGVVVRHLGGWTVLSAGRSLIGVRSGARALASATDTAQPGTEVETTDEVDTDDTLDETQAQPVGQVGSTVVQATVVSAAPGSITLQVGTQQVTIPLPAGLDLSSLVGQTVSLQLSFSNGNVQAQEDQDEQGDDDQGDDDQGGSGGGDGDGD